MFGAFDNSFYFNVRQDRFVGVCLLKIDRKIIQKRWYFCHDAETVFLSSPIFKFNDYKKKQERNILVTSMGVFNLKGTSTPTIIQPSSER